MDGKLVDITYLVADFKYNSRDNIKICEVQHGSLSILPGDYYLASINDNYDTITNNIAKYFNQYTIKKYLVGTVYKPFKKILKQNNFEYWHSMRSLLNDSNFIENSKKMPLNHDNINTYSAIVFTTHEVNIDINEYPGIIFIDMVSLYYRENKYRMNSLFNEELSEHKADWKIYPTQYNASLATTIKSDIVAKTYIIKPISEYLGTGVIIIDSDNLDSILKILFDKERMIDSTNYLDERYKYWLDTKDEFFIIEKYYESDHICVDNKMYDATIRMVFMLTCNNNCKTCDVMGGYWKLPPKSIDNGCDIHEKHISSLYGKYYSVIERDLYNDISNRMKTIMLTLYNKFFNKHNN